MNIPFTLDEFLDVFRRYNEAVWPAQWFLVALALVAAGLAVRGHVFRRTPALILAFLWLWVGIVYHLVFFRPINPAAVVFAAIFVIQAGFFAWLAFRPGTRFSVERDLSGLLGGLMIVFALVVYPSLGWMLGHRYPSAPTFGLPCPTTLFTFGILLWARPPLPRRVFVIPVLWSLVATSAAMQLGMMEDLSLPLAAIVATLVTFRNERRLGRLRPA